MKQMTSLAFFFLVGMHSSLASPLMARIPVRCAPEELLAEPIQQKPVLVQPAWAQEFSKDEVKALFDPQEMVLFESKSNIARTDVSTSHISNIIARGLKSIQDTQKELIQSGQMKPLIPGGVYSGEEYNLRLESTKKAITEKIHPLLNDLFDVYLEAVQRNQVRQQKQAEIADNVKYIQRMREQQGFLHNALLQYEPELSKKLGEIIPVEKVPFSYRDGYLVKIRFNHAESKTQITLYPRMIANQILGDDELFLAALDRWAFYVKSRLEAYEESLHPTGMVSGIVWFLRNQTPLNTVFGTQDSSQDPHLALLKLANDQAQQDLVTARKIHERMKIFTRAELYSLMDLFLQLRLQDIPLCRAQLQELHESFKTQLGEESSSASANITPEKKAQLDSLAKDIQFYEDIYGAFSDVAAMFISENIQRSPAQ